MFLQNRFMQTSNLGYNKDELIVADIRGMQGSRDAFDNQIKEYSGVNDVTYSNFSLSSTDDYEKYSRPYRGEQIMFQVLPVHHSFIKVMGIDIIEGRDFRQEDENIRQSVFIFNESARKQYGLELNTIVEGGDGGEIIGFMNDINFASFRMTVEPMAFFVMGNDYVWGRANFAYIKLNKGTNMRAAMSHINSTLTKFDANYTFEVRFFQ